MNAAVNCVRSPPRKGVHALVFCALTYESKPMLRTIYAALAARGRLKNSAESVDSLFCSEATGVPMTLGAPSEMGIGHRYRAAIAVG